MSDAGPRTPLVYLIAGEPSGDALGAGIMASLKQKHGTDIAFAGIGGEAMIGEGLESLFPMDELSVMGLVEVIPKLPVILRRLSETKNDILNRLPDVVVTIDSPDFCFRVAERVKRAQPSIPIVHYGAPTVWAWRPGRARKVAAFLDHMLCLYPFEPEYFEREGLAATFVGHPITDRAGDGQPPSDLDEFRKTHGIAVDDQILLVLPGSRHSEVQRLLPIFGETLSLLKTAGWNGRVILPTVEKVAQTVRAAVRTWPIEPVVLTDTRAKSHAFAIADGALAASGTVVLELAAASVPTVIAYKLNALTGFIAKRMITTAHVGLINILMGRSVMPEFLQQDCRPEKLAPAVLSLLRDKSVVDGQRGHYVQALRMLASPAGTPSDCAAGIISAFVANAETIPPAENLD